MNRFLATAAAVAVGVTLAGCGSTSRPQVDPDIAGKPSWAGCHGRSLQSTDYVSDAAGKATPRAAIAPYRTPGDHVERRAGRPATWLLVDEHEVIEASVGLEHVRNGWLVSTVEKCAR